MSLKKSKLLLDFSLLPEFPNSPLFKGLPSNIEKELEEVNLPHTLDRMRGASWFISSISTANEDWQNSAFLRAGLNEFRKIDHAIRWDHEAENLPTKDLPRLEHSRNPLVHLTFRMREVTIYHRNLSTRAQDSSLAVRIFDDIYEVETSILVVDDIQDYFDRNELRKYHSQDIDRICQWFNDMQQSRGAPEVFNIGIWMYCREICKLFAARRTIE